MLAFHLCFLGYLLLVHGFGIEQEKTEITEKYICHCLNRAGAYVGLPSLFPRLSPVAPVAANKVFKLVLG